MKLHIVNCKCISAYAIAIYGHEQQSDTIPILNLMLMGSKLDKLKPKTVFHSIMETPNLIRHTIRDTHSWLASGRCSCKLIIVILNLYKKKMCVDWLAISLEFAIRWISENSYMISQNWFRLWLGVAGPLPEPMLTKFDYAKWPQWVN